MGWQGTGYASVTIDLGRTEPISGVSATTAAGAADVTWPLAIEILVSDDDRSYRRAGDLVSLDHIEHGDWPTGYAVRRLVANRLQVCGRYVKLVFITTQGGPFIFTDEVEVFRGSELWLKSPPILPLAPTPRALFEEDRTNAGIKRRLHLDALKLQELISREAPAEGVRGDLCGRLALAESLPPEPFESLAGFRAILPIGAHHAELLKVQARLWRALGFRALTMWTQNPWDPLEFIHIPRTALGSSGTAIAVRGKRPWLGTESASG